MSEPDVRSRGLRSWAVNRGVNAKILVAVAVAALVAGAVGLVGLQALGSTNAATKRMYDVNFESLDDAAKVRRLSLQVRLDVANHALSQDGAGMAKFREKIDAEVAETEAALDEMSADVATPEQATALDGARSAFAEYVDVMRSQMLPAGEANDVQKWQTVRDETAQPIIDRLSAELQTLVESTQADARSAVETAASDYGRSRVQVLLFLIIGIAAALGLGIVVARGIVGGLRKVQAVSEGLMIGDLTKSAGLTSRDEVGRMGQALDAAVENLRGMVRTVDGSAGSLAAASEELSSVAAQMSAAGEQTSSQSNVVAAAAEQVSRNVQTVATGSEEMGASIREIAHNANEAARVAAQAVSVAESTNMTVSKLGESSVEIGNVVKVITSIAEQTNLLALNATIEAARAGEAGKGFAVVANEVKELAQETARATEDISRRVESIQGDTAGAVDAIGEISGIIARINDFQVTIASAVEEQTATTNEMNRNVAEAATGSGEIASNIVGVATAATTMNDSVSDAQRAVDELARMSSELQTLVGQFTV
jgi:methyl-accepting chemotaxis protein